MADNQASEDPKKPNEAQDESTKKAPEANRPDEQQLKIVSAVGYLGILFLVPMLVYPKEKFAQFHANQGLILLIFSAILSVAIQVLGVVTFGIALILWPLVSLTILVLLIVGVVNALNGHMKRLPLIGQFDIIKYKE